jgi:hypothetical protein
MQALSTISSSYSGRKIGGNPAAARQKQAVAHFHDVGLCTAATFYGLPLTQSIGACGRSCARDDLQTRRRPDHFVLESGVKVPGIFAKMIMSMGTPETALSNRQHAHRSEVG